MWTMHCVPEPAHAFPFELDTFQKEERYTDLSATNAFSSPRTRPQVRQLVSTPAPQQSIRTRAIYTSPIKTISTKNSGILASSLMSAS